MTMLFCKHNNIGIFSTNVDKLALLHKLFLHFNNLEESNLLEMLGQKEALCIFTTTFM